MLRVLKIGGSLLLREDLLGDLREWFVRQPPAIHVAIAGGGDMINAVRHWDRLRPSNSADIHWRCVHMLQFSFECLKDSFRKDARWPDLDSIDDHASFQRFIESIQTFADEASDSNQANRFILCNVPAFYRRDVEERPANTRLPESWDTTTDSIALWLAEQIAADECVLLKSCEVSDHASLEDLVQSGVIDSACSLFTDSQFTIRVERLPQAGTQE
ncbi:amino acid kinase family protein [Aporhodopirellula aestuarii]|uniref:Protein kinase n=1 Tax=Aporhodopirellula aestuarii TaxID=2950107 RepID=A0ABT0UBM3_9BACT|nr:protein kinase [Aporhodopirellula aestuarii]MCM2374392.1 protein kinase [Aporhodopirellula aestuarii]